MRTKKTTLVGDVRDQVFLLWVGSVCALYRPVGRNVLREVCAYLQINASLAFFSQNKFVVYHLSRRTAIKVRPREILEAAMVVHINKWEVLCIGTCPESPSVSSVNLKTFVITKEAPMFTLRNYPGTINAEGFVYVFGGYLVNGMTRASEKFSITSRSWTQIPEMDSYRVYFTPARHHSDIYLCSPANSPALSSYSILTGTYTVHPQLLPQVSTDTCVAFVVGDELFVSGNTSHFLKWQVGSAQPFAKVKYSKITGGSASCTETVLLGRAVYWADNASQAIVWFDLDTFSLDLMKY